MGIDSTGFDGWIKEEESYEEKIYHGQGYTPGFRTVSSYLIVSDGKGAIDFYKKAFGGKELARSLTPDGKIMNA